MHSYGLTPVGNRPEEFRELMRAETETWVKLIKQLGGKLE